MPRVPIAPAFVAGLVMTAWPAIHVSDFIAQIALEAQFDFSGSNLFFSESELHAQARSGNPPSSTASAKKPGAVKSPAVRADTSLFGVWRVTRGVVAPWVAATDKSWDARSWVGKSIQFEANRVAGPSSLNCGDARYEATSFPADALFQGGLKAPAKIAAQNLGFAKFPVAGTSLNCDAGLYEFHKLDATTELVAINNVIWTLDRSAGALASATSPAGVVQRFMEAHFAGEMGFDAARMNAKSKFMTPALMSLSKKYFAKPVPKGDAPDIDGDPFTDSQDYPVRFSVSAAITDGSSASVRVRFAGVNEVKVVTYQLRLEAGVWQIDDVKYDGGVTFRSLLTGTAK